MKKMVILVLVAAMLAFATVAWAMQPEGQSSLLLIKKGQLMKLAYENTMTGQVAEMVTRFKHFGWREPGNNECIPERPDIFVTIGPESMELSYHFLQDGHEIVSGGLLLFPPDRPSFWRLADSVMYYADKHRPPSLLHPPKP